MKLVNLWNYCYFCCLTLQTWSMLYGIQILIFWQESFPSNRSGILWVLLGGTGHLNVSSWTDEESSPWFPAAAAATALQALRSYSDSLLKHITSPWVHLICQHWCNNAARRSWSALMASLQSDMMALLVQSKRHAAAAPSGRPTSLRHAATDWLHLLHWSGPSAYKLC